jgi:hypothetical protein
MQVGSYQYFGGNLPLPFSGQKSKPSLKEMVRIMASTGISFSEEGSRVAMLEQPVVHGITEKKYI